MSTTVTYKGTTLTTATNQTKTLKTQGKYLEGDIIITDASGTEPVSSVSVAIATPQSGGNNFLQFGGLQGEPTSFSLVSISDIAIGTDPIVAALTYDGTNYVGQIVSNTSNAQASYLSTGFNHQADVTYHTIGISSENAMFSSFYSNYKLVYTYNGSSSDIHTSDIQVGSGATSITFPVSGRPLYWSCVFKSNFGTSSGYQRVIAAANDGANTYGVSLDSSAHALTSWTANYSSGNLTITSQGTNNGGYFHQPGYYQLTYVTDSGSGGGNYQTKTVTPTTSQQTVTPDSGYDALSQVTVNAMPTGSATPAASISGTSATVSTGTNTITLTKSVSNTPQVSAGYISAGTAGNTSVSLTASVTTKAAATFTPGTSNQTISSGTYLTGTQTIAGDSDLTAANIKKGVQIFNVTGTYTSDATATATDIVSGATAYVNGNKVTGSLTFSTIYSGSSNPSSSTGVNGDIYLKVVN